MPWHASLQLDYTLEGPRTVARHAHNGPLRILQSLYPEGDAVCHNVLVHPPGGLVGGDTLDISAPSRDLKWVIEIFVALTSAARDQAWQSMHLLNSLLTM